MDLNDNTLLVAGMSTGSVVLSALIAVVMMESHKFLAKIRDREMLAFHGTFF